MIKTLILTIILIANYSLKL